MLGDREGSGRPPLVEPFLEQSRVSQGIETEIEDDNDDQQKVYGAQTKANDRADLSGPEVLDGARKVLLGIGLVKFFIP